MITIINMKFVDCIGNKNRVIAEIFADDLSDILTLETVEGGQLLQGSLAYVIKTGGLYVMGSDGIWYNSEDGTSASTDSEEINESS